MKFLDVFRYKMFYSSVIVIKLIKLIVMYSSVIYSFLLKKN